MNKQLITIALAIVGGYAILYYLGKNKFTWGDVLKRNPTDSKA